MNKNNKKTTLRATCFATLCATIVSACSGEEDPLGTDSQTAVATQGVDLPSQQVTTDQDCSGSYGPYQITDLILATGQSNLIGPDTEVAATRDRWGKVVEFHEPDLPHPRVFAWTVDPTSQNAGLGWKVAQLTQSWHGPTPGLGGSAQNNFVFHFAKQLVENSSGCRVVGFVMVSEGGKGIAHWDDGEEGWNEIVRHLGDAMSAIGRDKIDGFLWHQGESDWIADGSCYPDDSCRGGMPDFYPQKLYSAIADPNIANPVGDEALINRIRRAPWASSSTPFIAAQTMQAPVNVHLNKLNSDNDQLTATVRGDTASGLEASPSDPFENHYSGAALRQLGSRYAHEYMKMKQLY